MLQLQQTCTGYPAEGLQFIRLPKETLLLYPSADSVLIRNAQTLGLRRVLAFWEAFSGMIKSKGTISCISVDSGMRLIIAAIGTRVVAWSLSDVQEDAWRVHSTLVLPEGHNVSALGNKAGMLAVGTDRGFSLYTLVMENDLPTWAQKWSTPVKGIIHVNFAPSLMYIATVSKVSSFAMRAVLDLMPERQHDTSLRLYSTAAGRQTQALPHPRQVTKIAWRRPQPSSRYDLILYSITSDSVLRIFIPIIDSPEYLQLHASLDLFSSLPFSVALKHANSHSSIFWLDRQTVGTVLDHILNQSSEEDESKKRRIQEIKDEGWDLFLRVLGDGSIVVTAVANIDRRPPTLLRQFTLQQSQPSIFTHPPSYLYLLPHQNTALLTMVTSTPLMAFELSPLAFFDAKSHGLKLIAAFPEREPEEERAILRLVRTPEGKGVGVIREDFGGDAWTISKRGTELKRTGNWTNGQFMIVLSEGHQSATFLQETGILTLNSDPAQTLELPRLENLFTMPSPSGCEFIIAVTADYSVIQIKVTEGLTTQLSIVSEGPLPLSSKPKFIQPVDPMAWPTMREWMEHDVLLSVSEDGELAFWAPEPSNGAPWKCTGKVRTGRSGFKKAKCSSMKKTALVVGHEVHDELTIWDSTESVFATGLEYKKEDNDRILDLDWSSTPDMQSILAVGYSRHVDILCQQRTTYFDQGPGWALIHRIDISGQVNPLLKMYLFGEPAEPTEAKSLQPNESLFEHVARRNGPLEDYNPQMLLQCLLWGKIQLVKDIIVNLALDVARHEREDSYDWTALPVERYLEKDQSLSSGSQKQYKNLFASNGYIDNSDENSFSRALVERLIRHLESHQIPHLNANERAHLIVLIQTTLEIDEQRRALDENGLRYLISMRSFYILNERASSDGTLPSPAAKRERLRYRDMLWAYHSESQDLLLNASIAACGGKMTWSEARAVGLPLWLTSTETLKQQFEVIARNEYMAGEVRDPTKCSLFYFALGKHKLVHGLWRQAAWHKEQGLMLKFLSNNFAEPRWRTAALKNAFALLSKQRYEYAAAFFLLGGSLKDAVNVCLKQLKDFQMAVAIARVAEQSDEGPILKEILSNTVIPIAFEAGNRYLGSWAFWVLHRRDLAVRILLTPLEDIASAFNVVVEEIQEPQYDDPSLALLFKQLRMKTLQAAKGTAEISGKSEFKFILQMAKVFCRMGCHVLALDLVRSWSFARPPTVVHSPPTSPLNGSNAFSPTQPLFPLEPALNKRASIMIDMDVSSLPPTRADTPTSQQPSGMEKVQEESDLFARKAGLGKLMKSAKQDVQVPEFDMNSFF
ncbi:hypothetical protein D9611_005764 [Ephemerocybe angulata]|uniref:RAVE complex protein Rav1 C-terminal domain-containing protein n=1 Tax=Ephemerocybe angulata TaxID=980116 RepID=A0A8H5F4L3_9AGAR|nr:hypothetical protein D9611_005764 [Tulosesus angulatus]